jgi:hypothetical protein
LLIRITTSNRGPEAAPVHVLPTLWFRNTWSWGRDDRRPSISAANAGQQKSRLPTMVAKHWELGEYGLYCSGADDLLFTENETNNERLYGVPSPTPYVKDAFHAYVVNGKREAVNPAATGTKAAARYSRTIDAGETINFDLRLASVLTEHRLEAPFADFEASLSQRKEEADEFYKVVLPPNSQRTRSWWRARPSPVRCGPSSTTTMSSRTGWRATLPSRPRRRSAWKDATASGRISSRGT